MAAPTKEAAQVLRRTSWQTRHCVDLLFHPASIPPPATPPQSLEELPMAQQAQQLQRICRAFLKGC